MITLSTLLVDFCRISDRFSVQFSGLVPSKADSWRPCLCRGVRQAQLSRRLRGTLSSVC